MSPTLTLEDAGVVGRFLKTNQMLRRLFVTLARTRKPTLIVAVEAEVATIWHPVPVHGTFDLAITRIVDPLHQLSLFAPKALCGWDGPPRNEVVRVAAITTLRRGLGRPQAWRSLLIVTAEAALLHVDDLGALVVQAHAAQTIATRQAALANCTTRTASTTVNICLQTILHSVCAVRSI